MQKPYEELLAENRELLRKNTRLEFLVGELCANNQELIKEKIARISKEVLGEQDTSSETDNPHS